MLHEQISYDGDGEYTIEFPSNGEADFSFADIEQSLLQQDFEHRDMKTGNKTTEIALTDPETDVSIKYDVEKDTATLYFTELSPTKEKVLDEALNIGHISNAFSLRELYHRETDEYKETFTFGTEEYHKAWNN